MTHILRRRNVFDMYPDDLQVAFALTDRAGVRWLRNEIGVLSEVPGSFEFADAGERIVGRLVPPSSTEEAPPAR